MNQGKQPKPNRAARRKAERDIKKAIRTGVGVSVTLAGYRVVRPDGSVKLAAGRQPVNVREEATGDSEQRA